MMRACACSGRWRSWPINSISTHPNSKRRSKEEMTPYSSYKLPCKQLLPHRLPHSLMAHHPLNPQLLLRAITHHRHHPPPPIAGHIHASHQLHTALVHHKTMVNRLLPTRLLLLLLPCRFVMCPLRQWLVSVMLIWRQHVRQSSKQCSRQNLSEPAAKQTSGHSRDWWNADAMFTKDDCSPVGRPIATLSPSCLKHPCTSDRLHRHTCSSAHDDECVRIHFSYHLPIPYHDAV